MPLSLQSTQRIAPNVDIPIVGLGVFRAGAGASTRDAVRTALELGYRHVDTAAIYRNEREVGEGLRASGVPRDEVFITTKLWNDDQGYDSALRAFDRSLANLDLDHVDLYLLHWPVPGERLESWRALERLHAEGRARAIGVSNFTERHLRELLARCEVRPAVNQVELHPFLPQTSLRALCAAEGIAMEAYSPLTKARRLDEPVLVEVANELGRTPAQVLLRWGLEQGAIILPKSTNPARIRENAALFDFALEPGQAARLATLEDDGRTSWDPTDVP